MRGLVRIALSAFLLIALTTSPLADAQWPQFRGPNGSGVDTSTGYPIEFSPTKNMAWKVAVPNGQSSPVIVGTRLYLTASEGDRLITISLDARTGKEFWRRDLKKDRPSEAFKANDPASPTPAADENGVVAFFPDFGLVSYGTDGQVRWTMHLGPFRNFYGMAGSPIIADGLVVLVCDQQPGAFAIALDRATGRQRWRVERPSVRIGWSTPVVFHAQNRTDVIVLGGTRLDAYDLATGAQQWWMPIGSGDALGTPVVMGDTVLTSTLGSNEPGLPTFASALAQYDKDKDGRLSPEEFRVDKDYGEHFGWIDTNSDRVIVATEWERASSTYIGEYGAIAVRPGQAHGQLPATTGRLLKEGRSPGALGEYYASPVGADGKVFLSSAEGKITVLQAAGEWQVLGVNELGEDVHATPALSEGRVYVRTHSAVFCFGASR